MQNPSALPSFPARFASHSFPSKSKNGKKFLHIFLSLLYKKKEVPCTDEKVRAMQCKLKEKWILSVCMEKLQADERMREKEIVIKEITTKEKEWMEHE